MKLFDKQTHTIAQQYNKSIDTCFDQGLIKFMYEGWYLS